MVADKVAGSPALAESRVGGSAFYLKLRMELCVMGRAF